MTRPEAGSDDANPLSEDKSFHCCGLVRGRCGPRAGSSGWEEDSAGLVQQLP